MHRFLLLLLALVAASLAGAAAARAHGDPATHFLELDSLYPAVMSRPSPELELRLLGLLQAAEARGYPIKVALVANEADLEDASLLRRPQRYAELLAAELRPRAPILVVTSHGFGVAGRARRGAALRPLTRADGGELLRGIEVPATSSGDALARAALVAVRHVARAGGRALPANVAPARVVVPDRVAGDTGWSAGDPLVLAGVFATLFLLSWTAFELWTRTGGRRGAAASEAEA